MIIVRHVYQAKYGKGDELVELLKEVDRMVSGKLQSRLLTDISGPFFNVVQEFQVASLAEWEAVNSKLITSKEFEAWFPRWLALAESGRREFFNLV